MGRLINSIQALYRFLRDLDGLDETEDALAVCDDVREEAKGVPSKFTFAAISCLTHSNYVQI